MSAGPRPNAPEMVREISWREVFPWLRLFDVVGVALGARNVVLGMGGYLFTFFGWWGLARAFSSVSQRGSYSICPWHAGSSWSDAAIGAGHLSEGPRWGTFPSMPWIELWWRLSAPGRQLFAAVEGPRGIVFALLALVWAALVAGLFGGALTRIGVLALGREERIGPARGLGFALRRWRSYSGAPLLPFLGSFLLAMPLIGLGLVARSDVGAFILALGWPVTLVVGMLLVTFFLGLFFGWPLMFASISAEGGDSFSALSESYSYVYQRPYHYLGYALIVTLLSMLAGWLVHYFAESTIYLTAWFVSLGSGGERMFNELLATGGGSTTTAKIIWFWNGLVRCLAQGAMYSLFWIGAAGIFLQLRRECDGTEPDELFLDETSEPTGFPPLVPDAAGVPGMPPSGTPAAKENQ